MQFFVIHDVSLVLWGVTVSEPNSEIFCCMVQESLLQQENTLSRGYNELLQSLGQSAAAQAVSKEKRAWDSPDILGKLDAM